VLVTKKQATGKSQAKANIEIFVYVPITPHGTVAPQQIKQHLFL
jgi:hypothetical protein